ncbi:MAG: hypothetical protein AAFQ74_06900 [Cyanobacteria bacterium J06623_4]
MKAIETTATIDEKGHLQLDSPLEIGKDQRVRVIVLVAENDENDPDDTPKEVVFEGLRQGLKEALSGQTISLSQLWEGIDAE